jgi:DICT domain-containing protein
MTALTLILLAVCITAGFCFGFALATKREAARWESIAKRATQTIIEAREEAERARGERNMMMVMLQDVASGQSTATIDEEGQLHVARVRPIVSH